MHEGRIFFVALALAQACASGPTNTGERQSVPGAPGPGAAPSDFFTAGRESEAPATGTLALPVSALVQPTEEGEVAEWSPAQLTIQRAGTEPRALELSVRPMGNLSASVCTFPKLELRTAAGRRLFLITHCNEPARAARVLPGPRQLSAHYLAYRVVEAAGIPTLRVELAQLRYRDSDTGEVRGPFPAFFLEHVESLAARLGAAWRDESGAPLGTGWRDRQRLDAQAVARLHAVEILLNNRDWRLMDLAPLSWRFQGKQDDEGIHNVFVLAPSDGPAQVTPIDLEISTFVGIPPGVSVLTGGADSAYLNNLLHPDLWPKEPWLFRWVAARLHYFQMIHAAEGRAALEHVVSRRAAIESAIDAAPVSDESKSRAKEHLTTFLSAVRETRPGKMASVRVESAVLYEDATGPQTRCTAVPRGTWIRLDGRRGKDRVHVTLMGTRALRGDHLERICDEQTKPEGWLQRDDID